MGAESMNEKKPRVVRILLDGLLADSLGKDGFVLKTPEPLLLWAMDSIFADLTASLTVQSSIDADEL
jgi:hypothetical protein